MKNFKKSKRQDEQISYATSKKNMFKCKLVFVGDQGVGKSSIINRFIKDSFDPTHNPTVGIDFVSKNLAFEGTTVRLQLWDTAGQQRFRSLIPGYLRDCQAALVVFDLTQTQTYHSINRWMDFVKQSRGDDALIYVIGNKSDLSSQKPTEQLEKLKENLKKLNCKLFEVSAKNGTNIQKVFREISGQLADISGNKSMVFDAELQKSKLIQVGIAVEKQRAQTVKKDNKQMKNKEIKSNKTIVLKDQKSQRLIKEKNCC